MPRREPFPLTGYRPPPEAARIIEVQTEIIQGLVRIVKAAPEDATVRKQVAFVLDKSCLWAITEYDAAKYKYTGQRYVSEGVKQRVEAAGGFLEITNDLRHDHVIDRALLREQLLTAESVEIVPALVSTAFGCVVIKAEHDRLPAGDAARPWRKYVQAGIAVWDRQTGAYVDTRASFSCRDAQHSEVADGAGEVAERLNLATN